MPQRKADPIVIAFLGTGAIDGTGSIKDINSAVDLIEELISPNLSDVDDPVIFLFPLTNDEFSDTMEAFVEVANKSDITYEVITSTSDKKRQRFTDIINGAAKTYHVADVYAQMEHILNEAPKGFLEVIWDKEREEDLGEIVSTFVDAGIEVRDLLDGNVPMGEEDETEEATTAAEPVQAEVVEEEADEESGGELPIYARSDLEKMSRAEVKEIALKLSLPPRKSSAAMVDEIMEAQGDFQPEPEEPEPAVVVAEVAEAVEDVAFAEHELVNAINDFPGRLHDVLDEFLTNLGKTVEGLIFNAAPEQPMAVEEPTRTRRLSRAR